MMKWYLCVSRAKNHFVFKSLILALNALIFVGCATTNPGRLEGSPEVTGMFRNSQILADHQYYFSGFQRVPYAIIAIDNKYQLKPTNWRPIDMDSTSLNQAIYRMEQVYSLNPTGAWLLDHEGNRLGIWYSSQRQTLVKRDENNMVRVVPPEPPDLRGVP